MHVNERRAHSAGTKRRSRRHRYMAATNNDCAQWLELHFQAMEPSLCVDRAGLMRTHSANKISPSRKDLQGLNSSTAPRKTPFISRSVTIRPDAARSLPQALASAFVLSSSCISLMHFLASKHLQGCRFAMYPPNYPFVFVCALIIFRYTR